MFVAQICFNVLHLLFGWDLSFNIKSLLLQFVGCYERNNLSLNVGKQSTLCLPKSIQTHLIVSFITSYNEEKFYIQMQLFVPNL